MNFLKSVRNVIVPLGLASLPYVVFAQGLTPVTPFAGTFQGGLVAGIYSIINIFLFFAALVAVLVIIYGGLRYILSRGEEDAAEDAKNTILYAVIGLIVIGLSAAIVRFTVRAIQGVPAGGG